MKKALKSDGAPASNVTDGLKSYQALHRDLGVANKQQIGRHANNVDNHCSSECHIVDRQTYKQRRSAALAEWRQLAS
jgi:putative transposase